MDKGKRVQIHDEAAFFTQRANNTEKSMNPNILPSATDK